MATQSQKTSQTGTAASRHPGSTRIKALRYLALLPVILSINAAWAQGAEPDCQCRAPGGEMRNLGTIACVDIVGTRHMVRCEMSTNTPYWKQLDGVEGCPDA